MQPRVLLATGIYPPETGGPATFVPALAADWCTRGFEVTVVTYGDEKTPQEGDWRVDVVSRSGGVLMRYLRYAWRVFRVARSADIVFLQGAFSEGLPGTLGAWLARRPTLLRVPGDFAWEGMQRVQASASNSLEEFVQQKKPWKWRTVFAIESWVARRARAVITPSVYLQCLTRGWSVAQGKQHVIYNTVELELNLPPREVLRREFGYSDEQKVLLVNARGVPWKRVDFLLEVLRELPASYCLVHVGEGPEVPTWKRRAADMGLKERVRFCGRVSYHEVQKWDRAADAFLLPSLYEGFPHVAVEAACQGAPCFVSDRGGNPEAAAIYPDRIRVLPYADLEAWKQALIKLPAPLLPVAPTPFTQVAEQYAQVLQKSL